MRKMMPEDLKKREGAGLARLVRQALERCRDFSVSCVFTIVIILSPGRLACPTVTAPASGYGPGLVTAARPVARRGSCDAARKAVTAPRC